MKLFLLWNKKRQLQNYVIVTPGCLVAFSNLDNDMNRPQCIQETHKALRSQRVFVNHDSTLHTT